VNSVWRFLLFSLLVCFRSAAQSDAPHPDLTKSLERQVRTMFSVPSSVNVKMSPLRPSQFPGYDAVSVKFDDPNNNSELEFLVAQDGKTLMRVIHVDLNKDPYAELMKKIDTSGRPTRGAKDAKVIAVNYDDFECPFCARMHATLFPELLKEYGDRIQFIYKDFPLEEIHPWAVHAAVDANCLAAQNTDAYWDFADYIHGNQKEINTLKAIGAQRAALDRLTLSYGKKHDLDTSKLQACVKAQDETAVRASIKEGEALGLVATPEMFVNGQKVDGALPIDQIRAAFDRALKDAGVAPPEHATASASTN
jgi:protein-disulfide isomerase